MVSGGALMFMEISADAVAGFPPNGLMLMTCTANSYDPPVVGVPKIRPLGDSWRPGGRAIPESA